MDNRARLLDCAQDLFAARGYDAVGVQEIVEAAGVTKPTLYHYFDTNAACSKRCWKSASHPSTRLEPGSRLQRRPDHVAARDGAGVF